jgi:hypothetical protein
VRWPRRLTDTTQSSVRAVKITAKPAITSSSIVHPVVWLAPPRTSQHQSPEVHSADDQICQPQLMPSLLTTITPNRAPACFLWCQSCSHLLCYCRVAVVEVALQHLTPHRLITPRLLIMGLRNRNERRNYSANVKGRTSRLHLPESNGVAAKVLHATVL